MAAKHRVAVRGIAGLLLSVFLTVVAASTAQAADIVVNSTLDPSGNTSQCTLREAIQSANGDSSIGGCSAGLGADRISFNIAGAGVKTINVTSPLPEITEQLTIDGYTQPGARPNSQAIGSDAVILIELRGQGINAPGLVISGHNTSRIQGLAIRNFGQEGIRIIGGTQHFVGGNFIGTDASGTSDQGNGFDGIRIDDGSTTNIIGGALVQNRNVISGNGGNGVRINGPETRGHVVTNNYIGTDAFGRARIDNGESGVEVSLGAHDNRIGGTDALARNLISSNKHGISIIFAASANVVQGNLIGTDINGTGNLSNREHGVRIEDSANNTIGGTENGAGNTIAFNVLDGVSVFRLGDLDTVGNRILRNSIFSNGRLGIDLVGGSESDGVTDNDDNDDDDDLGPNRLQNYPVLLKVNAGINLGVGGILRSTPSTTFRLEFFDVGTCDPVDFGEGQTFLGAINVTTNADGRAPFVAGVQSVPAGRQISATATNEATGDTSEFSECKTVQQPGFEVSPISGPTTENGGTATFTVALATSAAADVEIDLIVSDQSEVRVSPTTLRLPEPNGQVARTVTVTGLDDAKPDGDFPFRIELRPARSNDPGYNGLNPTDVQGVNRDNEGQTPPPCTGRPQVRVQTSQVGPGTLRATVTAQNGGGAPANALREIRFAATTNAVLDLPNGQTGVPGNVTLPISNGTQQVAFIVRRVAPGAFTAPLTAVDGCGAWQSFVGGGAGVP